MFPLQTYPDKQLKTRSFLPAGWRNRIGPTDNNEGLPCHTAAAS